MFNLLLAAILLWAAPPDPAKIKATGYLTDLAGVVDANWKQRIERLCDTLDRKTGAQIAVVTIRTLEGEPIEDYTNRWFRAWGVGRKENKGALLLLAVDDHRSRLEIGYGLEPIVPDGYSGFVLREMRPSLRASNYGEALYSGVRVVALRIAEKSGVTLDESAAPVRRRAANQQMPALGMIVLMIVGFLVFGAISSIGRRRGGGGPWIIGPGWGGGFGDSGGGGGGSGGFGGFGGFGGGDSGGGGASSDW